MRFCLAVVGIALLASWGDVTPSAAQAPAAVQCETAGCSADVLDAKAKAHHHKHAAKAKKRAPKEEYLRIAP